jgi:hypothetical protein
MSHSPQRAWSPLVLCLLACMAIAAMRTAGAADDFFTGDAQTPSPITDRFALRASFIHDTVNTELRLDPPGQSSGGTPLSGTKDLGFRPSENDGTVELMFRLRDRNRITVDYLELDQAGTTTLAAPIVFGSQTFNTGNAVGTSLQWRVMGLTWTYAIIQNDRFELAAGLGVHAMDLDVRGNVPSRFASYETSVAGALPTPALQSAWRITRRFSVTAFAQYLHAARNGTSGVLSDFHADAQFRWAENVAIGAGYSMVRLKLASVTDVDPGLVGISLRGPEVFVRASF